MSDMEEWQLIPESECDDQDDYPDDAQIRRDIAGWEQEYAGWSGCQLLPDEHFADEDTVGHATVFRDIKEGLEAAIAWERGNSEMRVTILTDDGRSIGPKMMTWEQYDARLQELQPKPPDDFTTLEQQSS